MKVMCIVQFDPQTVEKYYGGIKDKLPKKGDVLDVDDDIQIDGKRFFTFAEVSKVICFPSYFFTILND